MCGQRSLREEAEAKIGGMKEMGRKVVPTLRWLSDNLLSDEEKNVALMLVA